MITPATRPSRARASRASVSLLPRRRRRRRFRLMPAGLRRYTGRECLAEISTTTMHSTVKMAEV
ncbi:MAG: hypothetical protein RL477_1372 [Pseudomonadota bacterium]